MTDRWKKCLCDDLAKWLQNQDETGFLSTVYPAMQLGFVPSGEALSGYILHWASRASEEQGCKGLLLLLRAMTKDKTITDIPVVTEKGKERVLLWISAGKTAALLGMSRATFFRRFNDPKSELQHVLERKEGTGTHKPFRTFKVLERAVTQQYARLFKAGWCPENSQNGTL